MKKYLVWSIFISVVLYFSSSFAFPLLGERIVAPIMIICILTGGISVIAFIFVFIKEKYKRNN
jgi:hypothetical protein